LVETLASHGFVVASPEHTGSTYVDDSDSLGVAATRRVPDVKFLIDEILRRSQSEDDLLSGSIDADAIAVVGNSFGGSTAMGVAAGWAGASADPRVKAVVPISGVIDATGWSFDTFDAEELGAVRVPVMLIGATEDENVPIENNEYAFDGLVGSRAVYQVNVVGANHYHFAAACTFIDAALALGISWSLIGSLFSMQEYDETCGPDAFPAEQAFRIANLYTVAFLKRHLEGDERYSRYLTSAYADTEPDVEFRSRVAESP
jgi:predicted dienelactone hydrolase